jgi:hypothetical protein
LVFSWELSGSPYSDRSMSICLFPRVMAVLHRNSK